ncbi:hypothetical protein ABZ656_28330 [Streptomyces sp. NPDC007095]|uniref:hypothetical protein n=1 Tax=Streptomyces sp. NPDC007095 TaxID=3154482 RepID=UPI0033F1CF68
MELAAATRQAHSALWRFLAGIDLVPLIEYEAAVCIGAGGDAATSTNATACH